MKKIMLLTLLSLSLALAAPLWADEHPMEHPAEHPAAAPPAKTQTDKPARKAEHPAGHEHPAGSKAWNKQMRKEFNKVVVDHVKKQSAGGAFKVQDEKLGKEWALKLISVHKKRIVNLGGSSFFACADFKSVVKGDKAKLDLDFYATKGPEGWTIDKTIIHKVNAKPRYTYNSKNEMVPAKE
ncbi:MAG: hypothetical protein HY611_06160 [Elusimicrobia bacterium]|nr:hypothetical protein [Elusimicrobiota bacterium]